MVFQVAVVYYSLHGRLVTTANVVAEGARKVPARLCAQPSPSCRRGRASAGPAQHGLGSRAAESGWWPVLRAVPDRWGTGQALFVNWLSPYAKGA